MNDFNTKRKIIIVTGEDAKLVRAAEVVELNAERRVRSESPNGTVPAMISYETEQERAIIDAFRKMVSRYQMAYGLEYPPILVPNVSSPQAHQPSGELPRPYLRRELTDMELADLFLRRVKLGRKRETLFYFNGTYFERLPTDKFYTMIYGELREELSVTLMWSVPRSVLAMCPVMDIRESPSINNKVRC